MLYNRNGQELTKSERLILDIISEVDEYDYSITDTGYLLDISRQTVCRGFKKLVNLGFVTKEIFYEKNIRRCRYKNVGSNISSMNATSNISNINDTSNIKRTSNNTNDDSNNVNGVNTSDKSSNKGNRQGWVKDLGHKKRLVPKLTNQTHDNDLSNINNIYKSNQSKDTMIGNACQGVKSIFSKKIDKIFGEGIMDGSENVGKGSIIRTFKTIMRKISREKNENAQVVNKFFDESEEQDLHSVAWGVIGSVARRIADNTKARVRNLYAYMRTAIVKAVQDFFASRVDESEAKTLLYESVKQLHCTPATSISAPVNPATVKHKINHCSLAHNFEQREYDKEYIESFCENAPATPVKNKIDTSRLSRNFPQREYPEEYLESFYEKFDASPATSSPVTSTPAKDIVMEQVRAMRDSFSNNGRIKPLCEFMVKGGVAG